MTIINQILTEVIIEIFGAFFFFLDILNELFDL